MTDLRARLFVLAYVSSIVILIALVVAKTVGASFNPIADLRTSQRAQQALLVPGPAGWSMVRDVARYQYFERRMAGDWRAIVGSRYWAIQYVFGPYAGQAYRVSSCEGTSVWSNNGQYLGIFQMGSHERQLYGHGSTFLAQARAAYRYFVASGKDWSPWSCRP